MDNPNIEFVPDGDDDDHVLNDPNVSFVVNSFHQHYQNTESLWTNSNNTPTSHNFTGQEEIHIDSTNPVEIFGHIFDNGLINKIYFWINKKADVTRGTPLPKYSNLNKWKPVDAEELRSS